MIAKAFLDTKVLVSAFDQAEPEKRALAQQLLVSEKRQLVIITQVLQEMCAALTRGPYAILTPKEAEHAVTETARLDVQLVDAKMVLSAIKLARKHRISMWDGLILTAARVAQCEVVFSEDLNAGQEFDGVRVENPFAGVG